MKCKFCKKLIDDDSVFCKWCGEKVVRSRKKQKEEITVPPPKQLPSGTWFNRITVGGQRVSVSAASSAEYYIKAKALKAGLIEVQKTLPKLSLKDACEEFVAKRTAVLSPSTIRGYENIIRNRFKAYMPKDINSIDWQQMVNDEAKVCGPKTVKNSFGFIRSVASGCGIAVPNVSLPQLVPKELPWLTPQQIPVFLKAVEGQPCELAALFALHGLRKSEFIALTPSSIVDGIINVDSSRVLDGEGQLVTKPTTKNLSSRRSVPVRIPRLAQLLSVHPAQPDEPYISGNPNNLHLQINAVCDIVNLPHVGCHGLRRSFASLAHYLGWSERETMREGGWSDYGVMHKHYIKLSETSQTSDDSMSQFFLKAEIGNANANENKKP